MDTSVLSGTEMLKTPEKIRIRKKHQISFRRWMAGDGTGGDVAKYLGADIWSIREWIKSKMIEGMNWNNYGDLWVIDHIVPIRMFDVYNEEDLKLCWHYKNLMPLFKKDNLNKEGNLFFAYVLLHRIKGNDYYYNKLYERILPEVECMDNYIKIYCQ